MAQVAWTIEIPEFVELLKVDETRGTLVEVVELVELLEPVEPGGTNRSGGASGT